MKKVISILICSVLIFSMGSFNALANTDTEVGVVESLDFSSLVGNSIRSEGNQGLRIKYSVDFDSYAVYTNDGYSVEEIGVLAMRDSFLDGEELVKNGVYNYNKANVGVFYNSDKDINNLWEEDIASAVLVNIGFNANTQTYDFSAYAENYTTRMYTILSKDGDSITIYDIAEKASVVDVMKAIIDAYESETNPDEELIADYQSVQTLLNSTATDKNGKTVKEIYDAKYPATPTTPAKPSAPTVESKTDTTVTLTKIDGYEYSKDGITWQTSNEFTGLSAETTYNFYQRVAETDTAYASATSDALPVKTNAATSNDDEGWTGDYIINTKPR